MQILEVPSNFGLAGFTRLHDSEGFVALAHLDCPFSKTDSVLMHTTE